MSKFRIAVSISYGNVTDANYIRSTHLLTFDDVGDKLTEKTAKQFVDEFIKSLESTTMFGVYKEEFPNAVNPNPQIEN